MTSASVQAGMRRARQDGATVNRRPVRGLALALAAVLLAGSGLAVGAGVATTPAVAQSLFEWEREDPATQRRREEEQRRSRSQRRADYCRKLEQRLVQDWRRQNQTRSEVPQIREQLREAEREFRTAKSKAENRRCYEETFFFGRSLRRTPECVELDRDVRRARRDVKSLRQRIDRISRSGSAQSRRDQLIAELARYGCGEDYERQYEARRPSFFSFFDDRGGPRLREPERRSSSDLPFSTYRTMCVRTCDGYYFPVSFSTLPSQFDEDKVECADRCAAPSSLFVYRNPGEDVESMVSLNGTPYAELKNAWLYRKQFINGCSCDASEYSQTKIDEVMASLENGSQSAASDQEVSEGGTGASQDENGKHAASEQSGEGDLIIRDVPADSGFDPRQR